ncbi:hypothetical protein NIIDNTM18_12230 [Mycolicibacterium litorale]|uniref:Argininosuccinate lyase n=1 Tax=Mycolicibacterium litorale TaxID=758802 RepID=A0A6S6P0N9_9MYCO|nr:hypothetical protein [Mycolicibacterium litorale]BCI51945.1 hypothetical protein NIIDNTM18_12230 [Mycolicibacterium litorale]
MNGTWKKLALGMVAALVGLIGIAVAPASAQDRNVLIINETRHTIVEFYASNIGRDTWEEDILGEDVLAVGQSININIDDGTEACLYDFRVVFDDGSDLVRNRIDVCTIGTYRYTQE